MPATTTEVVVALEPTTAIAATYIGWLARRAIRDRDITVKVVIYGLSISLKIRKTRRKKGRLK